MTSFENHNMQYGTESLSKQGSERVRGREEERKRGREGEGRGERGEGRREGVRAGESEREGRGRK